MGGGGGGGMHCLENVLNTLFGGEGGVEMSKGVSKFFSYTKGGSKNFCNGVHVCGSHTNLYKLLWDGEWGMEKS